MLNNLQWKEDKGLFNSLFIVSGGSAQRMAILVAALNASTLRKIYNDSLYMSSDSLEDIKEAAMKSKAQDQSPT